ncbi:MAG: hypothetical protein ACI82I_002468 [Gammaproteobacteria bacterium]|jgi:hypothetical protein
MCCARRKYGFERHPYQKGRLLNFVKKAGNQAFGMDGGFVRTL